MYCTVSSYRHLFDTEIRYLYDTGRGLVCLSIAFHLLSLLFIHHPGLQALVALQVELRADFIQKRIQAFAYGTVIRHIHALKQ